MVVLLIGFYVPLPYKVNRTLICSSFYAAGYIYKITKSKIDQLEKIDIFLAAGLVPLYAKIVIVNDVAMGSNLYKSKLLFLIGAYAATYVVLVFSKIIGGSSIATVKRHLVYLGRNTVPIIIWQFLAFRAAILLQILLEGKSFKLLTEFPVYNSDNGWWILYTLAGIYGSLLINYLLSVIDDFWEAGYKVVRKRLTKEGKIAK